MDNDFKVSPDTQVVLLLCGALGRANSSAKPLTPGQYNVFAKALNGCGKRPSDLISGNVLDEELIAKVCAVPNDNARVKAAGHEQIIALLRRGVSLSTALDKWASYGIHVASRGDVVYPKRLREHLAGRAPSLIYYAGNENLFSGGGMAFVGSRDIAEEASNAIRKVVRECAEIGMPIVSGGARGADQTAMQEAYENGGKVIGALPCNLADACLEPMNREALASGNALLFSAFDPESRPFRYGDVAMDRNKYIYSMADACFVAQSGVGSHSGTWCGAVEELKRENHRTIFVYMASTPSEGCVQLVSKGAREWDMAKGVGENLSQGASASNKEMASYKQCDLFSDGFMVAEPSVPYTVANHPLPKKKGDKAGEEKVSPYGLFVSELRLMLSVSRKETEVKAALKKKFDLVPSQITHWLDRALSDGTIARHEHPIGKKGKIAVMLELKNGESKASKDVAKHVHGGCGESEGER